MTELYNRRLGLSDHDLVDENYREGLQVILVMNNLNTHVSVSLYKEVESKEAKRILDKFTLKLAKYC